MIGVVTTLEGEPLPAGDIASRLGGFTDVEALETAAGGDIHDGCATDRDDSGNQNERDSAYQDFQQFCNSAANWAPGTIPVYALITSPVLRPVEEVPMLVVAAGSGCGRRRCTSVFRCRIPRELNSSSAASCGPVYPGRSRCERENTQSIRAATRPSSCRRSSLR